MSEFNGMESFLDNFWKISKVAHDPFAKDFISRCQSHTINVNGKPYKYFQRGSGPTVLHVHGINSNLGSMVPIAKALLEQDYQVVLFDAPAHGEARGATTNPYEVREMIRGMYDRLGELHAVVAHSMGALWALSAWHSDVNAKAFVSISAPSNLRFLVEKYAEICRAGTDFVRELLREIENLLGEEVWTKYSPAEIVKAIHVPGLVLHGAKDSFVPPKHAADLYSGWHQSALELVESAGHVNILKSPEALTLISAYLRDVEQAVQHPLVA